MASSLLCPHCGVERSDQSAFCESCGKALPSALPSGPRIVGDNDIAQTTAGRNLQTEDLHKQIKKAVNALLAVAIIQTVVGLLVFGASQITNSHVISPASQNILSIGTIICLTLAAVFWGLYSWSQSQPLPAAIVGLVIYGTLAGVNIFTALSHPTLHPTLQQRGAVGPQGIGIGWVDIMILAALIRAISAAITYRKLLRESAGQFALTPSTSDVAAL
jgi:hypothetical protein